MSTGVFASSRGSWPSLVDQATRVSTIAVELSALSGDGLPGLVADLRSEPRLPFHYVSVHAPVKGIDTNGGHSLLHELPPRVCSIVVHPNAEIDLDSRRALGNRLTLENIDFRKDSGRVAAELEPFLRSSARRQLLLGRRARSLDRSVDERRHRTARPLRQPAPPGAPQLARRRRPSPSVEGGRRTAVRSRPRSLPRRALDSRGAAAAPLERAMTTNFGGEAHGPYTDISKCGISVFGAQRNPTAALRCGNVEDTPSIEEQHARQAPSAG